MVVPRRGIGMPDRSVASNRRLDAIQFGTLPVGIYVIDRIADRTSGLRLLMPLRFDPRIDLQTAVEKIKTSARSRPHKIFCVDRSCFFVAYGVDELRGLGRICPAGTLEAGLPMVIVHSEFRSVLGNLFALKVAVLLIVLIGSATVERFFCKVLCPLGALYGLLNRISFYRLTIDNEKCIGCGRCSKACPMSIEPTVENNSVECVRCQRCSNDCPTKALRFKLK